MEKQLSKIQKRILEYLKTQKYPRGTNQIIRGVYGEDCPIEYYDAAKELIWHPDGVIERIPRQRGKKTLSIQRSLRRLIARGLVKKHGTQGASYTLVVKELNTISNRQRR